MDRPFYYLSAEDVVPRDAVHVIIGGSVRVVPPCAFAGYKHLARVELQEGVEEIGAGAFRRCRNLARVDSASSLRRIGEGAFEGCGRLSELILREGLRRIGARAFYGCGVERIAVPSSLVTIDDFAFAGCQRLSELILREGLRRIGRRAFYRCALGRIAVPSSVVEIEEEAFARCDDLEAATLAEGMALVARGAFYCPRLERIAISSMAIVVEDGGKRNGGTAAVTGGIKYNGHNELEPARLILTSPSLASMSREDRTKLTDSIDQIIDDQTGGGGPLDLEDADVAHRIRACFANGLAEYKTGVAAVLELALWKANMSQRSCGAGGGETARFDAPTRDNFRCTCGTDVVVGPVLSYLWGPHRRADQQENGGRPSSAARRRRTDSPATPASTSGARGRWRRIRTFLSRRR